jgi:hypothetical protein
VSCQLHAPAALPQGKSLQYPLDRRLVGAQNWPGRCGEEKNLTTIKTQTPTPACSLYKGESIYRSQMDIKRKNYEILTWKEHLFLDISSTNIDGLVPSHYQCLETDSIEVV